MTGEPETLRNSCGRHGFVWRTGSAGDPHPGATPSKAGLLLSTFIKFTIAGTYNIVHNMVSGDGDLI